MYVDISGFIPFCRDLTVGVGKLGDVEVADGVASGNGSLALGGFTFVAGGSKGVGAGRVISRGGSIRFPEKVTHASHGGHGNISLGTTRAIAGSDGIVVITDLEVGSIGVCFGKRPLGAVGIGAGFLVDNGSRGSNLEGGVVGVEAGGEGEGGEHKGEEETR